MSRAGELELHRGLIQTHSSEREASSRKAVIFIIFIITQHRKSRTDTK